MKIFLVSLFVSSTAAFVVSQSSRSASLQLDTLRFTGFEERTNAEVKTNPLPDFSSPPFGNPYTLTEMNDTADKPARGPGFFGRGASKAQALLTKTKEKWIHLREKLSFQRSQNEANEIKRTMTGLEKQGEACQVLEMLMQAKEKTVQLKEVMKKKADASELEIIELKVELKKQERECKVLESQLLSITNEYENFQSMSSQEQAALQQHVDYRYSEMSNVLLDARELCNLLDEVMNDL
mmetsp:Transcript_21586/g.31931  ORF Transcript_21586/g.31931 Transcript_21586/m.31931 type:complete len:238 (-) Transcript_21586:72-785(-)